MLQLFNHQIQKSGLIILGVFLFFGLGTIYYHCHKNCCIPALEDHATKDNHHCTASNCLWHLSNAFAITQGNKDNGKKQETYNNTPGKITNLSTQDLSVVVKFHINPSILHISSINGAYSLLRAPPVFF